MSGFEEKLNAILSDPNAMAQVMDLARSLNLEDGPPPPEDGAPPPEPPPEGGQAAAGEAPLSGLGDLLGQVDPQMLRRLLPLVGELKGGGEQDQRLQLLTALRPFLKPERQEKVERAVRAARLIYLGKKLLTAMGENDV